VHYFDLADDRDFVLGARERSGGAKNGMALCSGWSAAPALTAVLARIAADGLDEGIEIDSQIAPGNRAPRHAGTVSSLLRSAGRPFKLWRDGAWREVSGWSEPRIFPFPPPVGPRAGYLVDVPDCALFPALFSARSVSFRAGAELPVLNMGMSLLAGVARTGLVSDWTPAAGLLRAAAALTSSFGSDSGAVGVEVRGARGGRPVLVRACVSAPHGGPSIAVLPASVTLAALSSGRRLDGGPVLDKWIDRAGLDAECAKRGWSLTVEKG
jgi:saccharopine dehydrogenase-like NADP-dependent oxidoreductase